MALDAFVVRATAYELNKELQNGRVNKITLPDSNEIILHINNNKTNYKLLISADASLPLIYLSDENKKSPDTAPAFCMLLRKHLNNAKILNISTYDLERIIIINFEHYNELSDLVRKKLIIELMGKHSNIIFVDDEDIILDSIKRIPSHISSQREVLPMRKYFIPQNLKKINILDISFDEFLNIIRSKDNSIHKSLYTNFAGLSPLTAEEILYECNINSDEAISILTDKELHNIYTNLLKLIKNILNNEFTPVIIYKNDIPYDFSAIYTHIYESENFNIVKFETVNEVIKKFYKEKNISIRIKQKTSDIHKNCNIILERLVKKSGLIEKQINDSKDYDKYRVYGDLLNTYCYDIAPNSSSYECINFYNNEKICIPLDKDLTPFKNAKKYYDTYSKKKRTVESANHELEKTNAQIEHLNSIINSIELATEEADLNDIKKELYDYGYIKNNSKTKSKKQNKENTVYTTYTTNSGAVIYVGKNNYQNEELSFKIAKNDDWWFHAKNVGGSHVILKSPSPSDEDFEIAASIAAYYSKNRDSDKVEVDYIQKKFLKKVPKSPPGFVIYNENWSITVKPQKYI